MKNWMLTHELGRCRHRELLREAHRARLARQTSALTPVGGAHLAMAMSLVTVLVMALVRAW